MSASKSVVGASSIVDDVVHVSASKSVAMDASKSFSSSHPLSKVSSRKPIKIDLEDIIHEVQFWESVVVCFVLGAHTFLCARWLC